MRVALILFLAISAFAQSDWNLVPSIQPGRKIKLKLAKTSIYGKFQSADASGITILTNKQEQRHEVRDIKRVALRTGKARALNAAKGAGIGGAIGAVVGFFLPGDFVRGETALLLGANGALYGAGIGALVAGYTTIYRAP